MSRQKVLSGLSLVAGILVVLVFAAHTAGIPSVHRKFASIIPGQRDVDSFGVQAATYLFAVLGLYMLFSGLLMIYAAGGLGRSERWAWTVTLGTGAFNLIASSGVLAVGVRNPFVLTWAAASLALSLVACFSYGPYAHRPDLSDERALHGAITNHLSGKEMYE